MRTTTLGSNGPEVGVIGLGCMGMTGGDDLEPPRDDATSIALIHRAVDLGMTPCSRGDACRCGRGPGYGRSRSTPCAMPRPPSRSRTASRRTWWQRCLAMPGWPRHSASTPMSPMPARRLWLTRSTPATDRACVSSRRSYWPSEIEIGSTPTKSSAEKGNRTLLSFLKTIGRSAVRTRGSGQEAPRDAVPGQRYWPGIGPAPPRAPRVSDRDRGSRRAQREPPNPLPARPHRSACHRQGRSVETVRPAALERFVARATSPPPGD